jgi:hypothetical protein
MANKVRIGIIGLGAQGSMYAKFIADGMVPNMEIGAICDHHSAKGEVVGQFGRALLYGLHSHARAVTDAVVTCVPHYLHLRWGINSLQRGITPCGEAGRGLHAAGQAQRVAETKPNPRTRSCSISATIRVPEIRVWTAGRSLRHTNWIITTSGGHRATNRARGEPPGWRGRRCLVNQAPQLDLWQWICGVPKSVYSRSPTASAETSPSRM